MREGATRDRSANDSQQGSCLDAIPTTDLLNRRELRHAQLHQDFKNVSPTIYQKT